MDFWTAPESRQSSPVDQFTVMSPMLAEWLFLWIPRRFTIYSWVSVDTNSLNIRELLNSVNWSFQNFPIMSHAMLHPWRILGQGFSMISGLFHSWCIHDYRQKSTVQSPESSKIVQKNTHKLTAEPLLLWINESPESWVQCVPSGYYYGYADALQVIIPVLAYQYVKKWVK